MGRERKCILCQIVYSSKQEMDEHMKSMLHHRELENLKGRDCGHECRVCRVTMVSLTDYADHISSRVHKQRVETAEREGAGNDQEEEYFDKDLVKLIEIRKEVIRREEEAAAKRAREEEAQRREEEESRKRQQQIHKWNDARQYFYQKGASWDWRYLNKTPPTPPPLPPPRKCNGPTWQGQGSWDCSSNPAGVRSPWETQEDIRFHWHDRKQGRSATWHAQGPHNVFKWCAGQRGSGSLHSREGTNKRWQQEDYLQPPTQQQRGGRGAWQQNGRGGGSTSLYSSSRGGNGLPGVLADPVVTEGLSSTESLHRMDLTSDQLDPVGSFDQLHRDAHFKPQDDGRKGGHQNMAQEGPAGGAERDRKSGTGPKASGSNPKLDKACRWSPYPSHKETYPHPHPSEKHPKGPPPPPTFQTPQIPSVQGRDVDLRPRRDITLDLHHSSGLQPTQSRRDLRAGQQRAAQHQRSPDHSVEGREPRKNRDISIRISSSDTSNSLRTDRQTTSSSSSSGSTSTGRRATKPSECLEKGLSSSSTTNPKTHLSRASSPTLNLTSSPKTHLSRASSPSPSTTSSPKTHLSRASSPTFNLTSSPKTHLSRASSPSPTLNLTSSPKNHLSRASSPSTTPRTQLSRASSQDSDQPRLTRHRSQDLGRRQGSNSPQQDQEQLLTEMLRRAKETLLDKRSSVELSVVNPRTEGLKTVSNDHRMEIKERKMVLHIEEQQQQQVESSEGVKIGDDDDDDNRQKRGKTSRQTRQDRASSRVNPGAATEPLETMMEFVTSPSDNHLSVQSVQVSTSTVESPGGAVLSLSPREEEEEAVGEKEAARGLVAGAGEEAMEVADAGLWSDGDPLRTVDPNLDLHTTSDPSSGSTQTKPTLPLALKRDLTRHIGSKTKSGGSHEPNLNIARRIRNVSGTRRGDAEKDSGLKPTLRQLISSSGSRRCVNWDQVYQEVHRKKQQQGKGMPRFGIEMVSCDQEGEDIPLTEGFQWETLFDLGDSGPALAPVTPRKRSLSESSVAPDRSTANLSSLFGGQTQGHAMPGERAPGDGAGREVRCSSEQQSSSSFRDPQQPKVEGTQCEDRVQGPLPEGPPGVQPRPDSVMGDSSSGTEQTDTQGARMKRRAAGDIPCPEIPNLERKNKRLKVKSKKERLQVDHLLAVSLREEDLSRSLQGVDNSLLQARAALQAAYMEVQRLLVVKQQVSMEMSTLRRKRIELLQGIQGGDNLSLPRVKSCEEEMPLEMPPSLLSPLTEAPVTNPNQVPLYLPLCSTPPSLSPSHQTKPQTQPVTQSVVIKQEPLSPGRVTTETEVAESTVTIHQRLHYGPHSTTPEPTPIPTAPRTDCALSCQPVRGRKSEHHRASRELSQEDSSLPVGACVEWKDPSAGSPGLVHSGERGVQVTTEDRGNFKPHPASLSGPSSRKSSRAGVQDLDTSPVLPPSLAPSIAPPQAEVKTVKRVRKLKKKRVLRKAKGEEQQLDNSDTELETETTFTRPVRLLGTRRKASGGCRPQVTTSSSTSTSSPPGASEDKRELPRPPRSPATRPEEKQEDSDSSLEMVVLPQAAPVEVVTIDTSGPEDGDMDICGVACPQPQPTVSPPAPDTLKTEPQKLACNEVTSTSEMDGSSVVKSEVQLPLTSVKLSKTSSDLSLDASSEPGDDDLPSEGMFEGHQETVNAMQVHMGLLYTCSGDRTVRAFSLVSRECVAVFEGHSTKVNCLLVSSGPGLQQRLYSGSSDQTIRCYNLRSRECVDQFSLPDRVLCLHNRWKVLYAGLANGSVVTLSLKTNKQLDVFECHGPRAVSCLATAQEGARRILLVGSYDSTISIRDAKSGLLLRTLEGHTKTVLCMKVVNDLVFSGSSDQSVHAHNIHTGELVRIYKGHSHAVTVVAILGKVMVTACLDKLVRVYELQSHDRLQVYGGHADMVMCMAIHKSMIYTGCYDGSVQAVKLSLIQNYHCRWHGCSLIFGVLEHLQQHLLQDHVSPNTQNLKCRWKNCDEYFTARNGSKQGAPRHMLQHVEEEWSKPAQP
ncbi:zinc finger protein 106 isoform X3 [Salmo salar]|uniref:Zinc finger protein 106 isoform X3 n=2 Tax=Salmo salar TaxID=8030 RepID=A0ABM3F8U7_SALSA|nr:zinc finger protein 106-like isoform X3 [Salmo salar]